MLLSERNTTQETAKNLNRDDKTIAKTNWKDW